MTTSSSSNAPSGSPENRTLQVRSQATATDKPGQYGMRVFQKFQKRLTSLADVANTLPSDQFLKETNRLSEGTIRYSPARNPLDAKELRDNALGYAEAEIQAFDHDGDHALGQSDLEAQAAKDAGIDNLSSLSPAVKDFIQTQASQYLKAVDLNGNGKITADEEAAHLLISDNAPEQLAVAYEAMAETADTEEGKEALLGLSKELKAIPSSVDCKITQQDRLAMETAIANTPNIAKLLMQQVSEALDLPTRYQQLQEVWKQ